MVNKTVAIFITILLLGGVIFTPEATPSNAQADLTSTPTPLPTETLAEVSSPTPAETGTPTETPTSTPEASSTPEISVTDTLTPISEASATVEPVATLTLDISPTLTPMPDWALPLPTAAPEAQTSAETGTLEPTATPSGYDGGGQTRSTTSPACAGQSSSSNRSGRRAIEQPYQRGQRQPDQPLHHHPDGGCHLLDFHPSRDFLGGVRCIRSQLHHRLRDD